MGLLTPLELGTVIKSTTPYSKINGNDDKAEMS